MIPLDEVTIKVPVVVGVGECQVVVRAQHRLHHGALEIKRITKKVRLKRAKVGCDKVVINGIVRKNVEFETEDHLIGSDKFDVPFECCIHVCGARKGDKIQLLDADVEVEEDQLKQPFPSRRLDEKLCVRVLIKVTRLAQVTVPATEVVAEGRVRQEIETEFDDDDDLDP